MNKKDMDKAIASFFITEKDYEKNLYDRVRDYYLQGFRVRKPATDRRDIIYPNGKHRREDIDREILMLCHWLIRRKGGKK